jgi:hypothetical protein
MRLSRRIGRVWSTPGALMQLKANEIATVVSGHEDLRCAHWCLRLGRTGELACCRTAERVLREQDVGGHTCD